ncbi:calcium-binding protein [Donghicola sp. C2-DW-16]|uniref:Calcium-binding protein n=1 Tax=Donghicola mangrovi TaxID=2729614 RepID=A0ABX2PK57_9RHOB|nr:calcium-binding protein [Donghicola mangrovi]NVO29489.1 calcium-binding protein [Donghicola mangrovi]
MKFENGFAVARTDGTPYLGQVELIVNFDVEFEDFDGYSIQISDNFFALYDFANAVAYDLGAVIPTYQLFIDGDEISVQSLNQYNFGLSDGNGDTGLFWNYYTDDIIVGVPIYGWSLDLDIRNEADFNDFNNSDEYRRLKWFEYTGISLDYFSDFLVPDDSHVVEDQLLSSFWEGTTLLAGVFGRYKEAVIDLYKAAGGPYSDPNLLQAIDASNVLAGFGVNLNDKVQSQAFREYFAAAEGASTLEAFLQRAKQIDLTFGVTLSDIVLAVPDLIEILDVGVEGVSAILEMWQTRDVDAGYDALEELLLAQASGAVASVLLPSGTMGSIAAATGAAGLGLTFAVGGAAIVAGGFVASELNNHFDFTGIIESKFRSILINVASDGYSVSANGEPVEYSGDHFIVGGDGNDTLHGGAHDDVFNGMGGDDIIHGNGGADEMHGGRGNDTYYVDNVNDRVFEVGIGKDDNDVIFSTVDFELGSNVENIIMEGVASISAVGNNLGNYIKGNGGNNTIAGGFGEDLILGGGGDDDIDGGRHNDTIKSGSGNDTIDGGSGSDTIEAGSGDDTVVIGGRNDGDDISGGEGRDWIEMNFGSNGRNVIIDLDDGLISSPRNASGGFSSMDIAAYIDGFENVQGSNKGDYIYGNDQANIILGQGGGDYIYAGLGRDTVYGGAGKDKIYLGDDRKRDIVVFGDYNDSKKFRSDKIFDFDVSKDVFNFSKMDFDLSLQGDQAADNASIPGVRIANGIWLGETMFGDAEIFADVDGNKRADFRIVVDNVDYTDLTVDNFVF